MLVSIKSVPENSHYLLIDVKFGLASMIIDSDMPERVYREMQMLYFGLFEHERITRSYVSGEVAIRKDSIVGDYLLSHPELCENEDEKITYDKVVSAYNIATFTDNHQMVSKILPYFKERISGNKKDLITKTNGKVLDYILKNGDFQRYLDQIDDKVKNTDYIVYENGEYVRKSLRPNLTVVKRKTSKNG